MEDETNGCSGIRVALALGQELLRKIRRDLSPDRRTLPVPAIAILSGNKERGNERSIGESECGSR